MVEFLEYKLHEPTQVEHRDRARDGEEAMIREHGWKTAHPNTIKSASESTENLDLGPLCGQVGEFHDGRSMNVEDVYGQPAQCPP